MSDVALDVRQRNRVFLAAETDRVALGARARRAPDAMHVVLRIVRQIEIEDMAHIGNVQASRGHVGGDQHGDVAVVKVAHHLQPLVLRHVAGERLRDEAVGRQGSLEDLGQRQVFTNTIVRRADSAQQPDQQRNLLLGGGDKVIMPRNGRTESSTVHTGDSSFVSLLSGWVQQGVENFFATQRILVDLAMSQNANAMNLVRSRLTDSDFCPAAVLTELAGEGMSNFIEGQKLLLNLAQKEYEIVATGVKERVSGNAAAVAITDLAERGFNTFVEMQLDFLKLASKQTHTWLTAVKAGKGFDTEGLVETAQDAMEHFRSCPEEVPQHSG